MDVTTAEVETQLDALLARVEAGESFRLLRDGRPVARLEAVPPAVEEQPRKRFDMKAIRALTASMPLVETDAGDFMRRFRDDERY